MADELRKRDRTSADNAPGMGARGYIPDEDAIRRAEFAATPPVKRVLEGIALSRVGTRVAIAGRDA